MKKKRLEYIRHFDDDYWADRERYWGNMASKVTVIKPDQTREDVEEELKKNEEEHKQRLEKYRGSKKRVGRPKSAFRGNSRPMNKKQKGK